MMVMGFPLLPFLPLLLLNEKSHSVGSSVFIATELVHIYHLGVIDFYKNILSFLPLSFLRLFLVP